ncbi:MAG TPA: helix-turn-helix transcriptional regulator [Vicinamibacterales bacterium]|nr:helix-turn-helix transcriptional regulator [Vicinamibacterales bacterium]
MADALLLCTGVGIGAIPVLRLRHERLIRGWTQTDLGQLTDITQPTLSAIERGELAPTDEQLDRLARTLGVESGFDLLLPVVAANTPTSAAVSPTPMEAKS